MKVKRYIQNAAIIFLVLIALKNLVAALPFKSVQHLELVYSSVIDPAQTVIHHTLSSLLGILMLLLTYRLYKRIRLAWVTEVALLLVTIAIQVIRYHRFTIPIVMVELFVLLILIATHKDFGRKTDRLTVPKALGFIAVSFALLLVHSTIGIFIMKSHLSNIRDIYEAFAASVKLLILMDPAVFHTTGAFSKVYVASLIALNWSCIIAAVFLLLKPAVLNPIITRRDRDNVRQLVLRYGQNPMAYLALENDKKYFFGSRVEGVCAYTVTDDVFIVCGDMICEEKDGFAFLSEIMSFCNRNAYQMLFINITDYFLGLYQSAGFGVVKYGEDCCFKLADYSLAGGRVAKVRAAINHATKQGITVHEYKPLAEKDPKIEYEMLEITEEWLQTKGGYELGFMVGGTGLELPLDRRYFYAVNENGAMLGFAVFLPYRGGYLADVTRRRSEAPQGVLEKIIYEAFMQFKADGVEWANMGLSPLYNISEGDRSALTEKLFSFIYEHMNSSYGFKQLHHAKEKYAPTHWMPRYLAFYPKPFSPKLALALVRCQYPAGISRLVLSEVFKKDGK